MDPELQAPVCLERAPSGWNLACTGHASLFACILEHVTSPEGTSVLN